MLPLMILKEEDFTAEADDYTTDEEGKDKETKDTPKPANEDAPPPEDDGEGVTANNVDDGEYSIDGGEEETIDTPEDDNGDDPPADGEDEDTTMDDGEEDYTIDGDTEEMADDTEGEEVTADGEEEVTSDSEMPEDEDKMYAKKVKKLLKIYKSTLGTVLTIQNKVSSNVFPTNAKEEYVYKIIMTNLDKTRKMLVAYILDEYNTKEYEENVYRLYHFKSQLEMVHVLLKKIKSCRDINKTI